MVRWILKVPQRVQDENLRRAATALWRWTKTFSAGKEYRTSSQSEGRSGYERGVVALMTTTRSHPTKSIVYSLTGACAEHFAP